jgi:hypothetical protein
LMAHDPNDRSTSTSSLSVQLDRKPTNFSSVRAVRCVPLETDRELVPTGRLETSLLPSKAISSGTAEHPFLKQDDTPSFVKPAAFVAGSLIVTAALIRSDQQTYQELYRWKQSNAAMRDLSPIVTELGDGRTSMGLFGGYLAYSFIMNDHQSMQVGKLGLESFVVSGIITQILKHTFSRERPSAATVSGGRWNGPFAYLNQNSNQKISITHFDAFPSGHTATAFAAATTFSEFYGDKPWVSYVSYSLASGVAVSRVMERTHWASDCFVGGLIGYFSTKLVFHLNQSERPVVVLPTIDGEQVGLALAVRF